MSSGVDGRWGLGLWALAALVLAGCGRSATGGVAAAAPPAGEGTAALVVERGDFAPRLLLTGEVASEAGVVLSVPPTAVRRTQIRWLAKDGSYVSRGDRLIDFDNSSFAGDLGEKRLELSEKARGLAERQAALAAELGEAAFDQERKRAELAKARLDAGVPPELLAKRQVEERGVALRRAEVELEKSAEDLKAKQAAGDAELARLRLELERQRREIAEADAAIAALSIRAPQDGLFVVADHPWEGRKLREGDTAWQGLAVARLPDLGQLSVTALLSDVDFGKVALGASVRLTADAFPELSFTGKVVDLSPIARDDVEGSQRRFFAVKIEPEAGAMEKARLRPGMSVKAEVAGERRQGALLVPRVALDLAAQPPRAALADGSTAEVQLGPCDAFRCVALSGLAEGQRLAPWRRG
ncbi:MAG: efflux RND transporter periplasmic adaptor subunit [Thermoanaerobaculia bacterium]